MPKIIQLPSHIADLIAAGEVVERPASVAKELVENSIDAGAQTITVEIQNGGLTFLRVTDNGCGMAASDAETAFLRHATSKIRGQEDLAAIHTLGFRGEALAATAAVSHIDLMTKVPGAVCGTALHLDAGTVTERSEAGCPDGTTIIVRNLFYNTPARMKFMKQDTVEGSMVFSAVQKQALSHPEISFRFIRDGKELLHTPGDGALLSAVYAVFGRKDALELVEVDSHWEKISLRGYVSRPTAARGTRGYQHFFLNGRYIRNRILSAALEEAYQNQIMTGRFPSCVLHISMPEAAVDVNVHPAKTEVKFLSEREVFDCIHYGVLSALSRASGRVEMKLPQKKQTAPAQPAPKTAPPTAKAGAAGKGGFTTMTAEEYRAMAQVLQKPEQTEVHPAAMRKVFPPAAPEVHEPVFLPRTEATPVRAGAADTQVPAKAAKPAEQKAPEQQELPLADVEYRIVGEVLDTYFVVEQNRSVLLIDKHAAHERILFERLKAQTQPIMGQLLMTPVFCTLAKEEAAAVLENRTLLEQLGYGVDDFGDGTVVLRQIPCDIALSDAEASLSELAGKLLSGRRADPTALRDELLHTIACKAAIKAGYHTQKQERDALVKEVLTREDLKYCPHGRPICICITEKQLEKQFKRV